jgi:predicted transcriptional regulator
MTIPNAYLRRKIVDVLGEIGPSTSETLALKVNAEQHSVLPALRSMAAQGLLQKLTPRDRVPLWRLA